MCSPLIRWSRSRWLLWKGAAEHCRRGGRGALSAWGARRGQRERRRGVRWVQWKVPGTSNFGCSCTCIIPQRRRSAQKAQKRERQQKSPKWTGSVQKIMKKCFRLRSGPNKEEKILLIRFVQKKIHFNSFCNKKYMETNY